LPTLHISKLAFFWLMVISIWFPPSISTWYLRILHTLIKSVSMSEGSLLSRKDKLTCLESTTLNSRSLMALANDCRILYVGVLILGVLLPKLTFFTLDIYLDLELLVGVFTSSRVVILPAVGLCFYGLLSNLKVELVS